MSAQLCLVLSLPRSRRSDPKTSKAAASRAAKIAPSQRNIIADALREGPATVRELERRTGLMAHAIGKRMIELERLGLAAPTGVERDGMREWLAL